MVWFAKQYGCICVLCIVSIAVLYYMIVFPSCVKKVEITQGQDMITPLMAAQICDILNFSDFSAGFDM